MRVPSPSDRIYACARLTMNLRYVFNNCAFARVRTYILSTQLGVIRVLACVNAPIFMKTGSFTRIFPPG